MLNLTSLDAIFYELDCWELTELNFYKSRVVLVSATANFKFRELRRNFCLTDLCDHIAVIRRDGLRTQKLVYVWSCLVINVKFRASRYSFWLIGYLAGRDCDKPRFHIWIF